MKLTKEEREVLRELKEWTNGYVHWSNGKSVESQSALDGLKNVLDSLVKKGKAYQSEDGKYHAKSSKK